MLPRALLYEGPGYPYAIEGHSRVHGTLLVAAPGIYGELLGLLDHLEEFLGPGHPRNLYERVVREVEPAGPDGGSVRAWVYLAATAVTRSLRTGGVLIPGGGGPPDAPRAAPEGARGFTRPEHGRRRAPGGPARQRAPAASASATPGSSGPRKRGSGRSRASRAALPEAASSRTPP